MKAVVCTKYGPPEVLQLRELEEHPPKHDEVRIKIHAAAVTSSDCIVRSFNIPASMWIPARLVLVITKPRRPVLGMVLAGEIENVGKDVRSFTRKPPPFRMGACWRCTASEGPRSAAGKKRWSMKPPGRWGLLRFSLPSSPFFVKSHGRRSRRCRAMRPGCAGRDGPRRQIAQRPRTAL